MPEMRPEIEALRKKAVGGESLTSHEACLLFNELDGAVMALDNIWGAVARYDRAHETPQGWRRM